MKTHVQQPPSRNRPNRHSLRTNFQQHSKEGETGIAGREGGEGGEAKHQEEEIEEAQEAPPSFLILKPILVLFPLPLKRALASEKEVKRLCDAEKTYTMNYLHNRNGPAPTITISHSISPLYSPSFPAFPSVPFYSFYSFPLLHSPLFPFIPFPSFIPLCSL